MAPTGCPETSVRSCRYSLHNNPQERNSPSTSPRKPEITQSRSFRPLIEARLQLRVHTVPPLSFIFGQTNPFQVIFCKICFNIILKTTPRFCIFNLFELNLFCSKFRPYCDRNFHHALRPICGCDYRLWLSL